MCKWRSESKAIARSHSRPYPQDPMARFSIGVSGTSPCSSHEATRDSDTSQRPWRRLAWIAWQYAIWCGQNLKMLDTGTLKTLQIQNSIPFNNMGVDLGLLRFRILTLYVLDLLRIGLLSKDLNINPGTYPGKGAAAGVQDVHSPETYHFPQFLEEKQSKITKYRSRMLEVPPGAETLSWKAFKGLMYHHK